MSTGRPKRGSSPELRTSLLCAGAALAGAATALAVAGFTGRGSHLLSATGRWVREMKSPPSEAAKLQWAKARSAMAAGTAAWHSGVSAQQVNGT